MTHPDAHEAGRMLDVDGIATNVHTLGDGEPVLLLHGSGPGVSAWANWRLTIPSLQQRFRVVAPDLVGFGYTARPHDFAYEPASWLHHIVALLDRLDLEQVSVVGNSFGGGLALRLAVECPDRVRRLVLMGSVGVRFRLTPALDAVWGYQQPSPDTMRALLESFVYDREVITDALVQSRYDAARQPHARRSYEAMFPAPRQRWIGKLAVPEAQLESVPHSTLILHGRDDRIIPLAASLRLHDLLENSDLHVFGRCGHWAQIEAADRFAALVADFVQGSVSP